jgi:lambda family phage portal protein
MDLIYPDGSPMRAKAEHFEPSYQASDQFSQELASWRPYLASPDAELLYERDTITARIRDMVRNNGWASNAVSREIDNVIGNGLRLSSKPDYRALGLDEDWAHDFAQQVEALWRSFAHDPNFYCDAARHSQMGGLFGLAYRHYVIDGDALAVLLWLPDRPSPWATAVQIVHPDRLSNPNGRADTQLLRGGVELDDYGAAVAYHIRKQHPNDLPGDATQAFIWERVPRETEWGRPIVVHHYDKDGAGQTRGIGRLTPILERLKMLDKYDRVELQAAVLNAILAAFIESPFDHEFVEGILGDDKIGAYQEARTKFHKDRKLTLGGVRIPILFPGEKIGIQGAARPAAQFAAFEAAALRNIAAGTGQSYEQLSGNWSEINYSSARAALLEIWKTMSKRRGEFDQRFATPIYIGFLEEVMESGAITLPAGAPSFQEARAAYARCRWIGPGRGWVDPLKEKQSAVMGIAAGLSTLEMECAEQGLDYEEIQAQLAREIKNMPKGVLHPAQIDFAKIVGGQGSSSGTGKADAQEEAA